MAGFLCGQGSLKADWISDWNQFAMNAARDSAELSPEAARSMAMMNTAIYNAVQGITGSYQMYGHGGYTGPSGTAVGGASADAAAAAAAYTVLADLYPSMAGAFSTLYANQLSSLMDEQAKLDGINFGTLVANDILNWRATDNAAVASNPGLYAPVGSAGYWAETSANSAALPGWGAVYTFGIASPAAFSGSLGMSNPDYIATASYATDFNEVKALGAAGSVTRTAEQTDAAFFWQGAPGTVTNVGLWNDVAKDIVTSQGLTLSDSARLYAALNVALADAAIVAWDTKFAVDLWSPATAIQNGGADLNPATAADGSWSSLLLPPDVPSFFAEQAILGGAAAGILEQFAGTNYAFTLSSDTDGDGNPDLTFNFSSLAAALAQASDSVVWGGTSFRTAATQGATAGDQIADSVMGSQFAPVPEPSGVLLLCLAGMTAVLRRQRRAQG